MKKTIILLIAFLVISIGCLNGCIETNQTEEDSISQPDETEEEEQFIILPDGTNVTGDIDKIEILNYSVVTEQKHGIFHYIDVSYEKIADGFVYSKNASRYRVNVTAKNIVGELLDRVEIRIRYYDDLDNLLHSDPESEWNWYINETRELSFIWYNSSYSSYFEHVDHISFKIVVS